MQLTQALLLTSIGVGDPHTASGPDFAGGDPAPDDPRVHGARRDVQFSGEVRGPPVVRSLRQFDQIILVECKNWSKPVGASEVTIFNAKLEARGRPLGILVAAGGITGDADDLSAAHQILFRALGQKREILVVTRGEIEQLCDTDDLVRLLKRKKLQLAVSGTIYGVS